MRLPVITQQKDKLAVFDNLLSNTEAELIAKAVFNKPDSGSGPEYYLWNQLYSLQNGNTLPYNHEARALIEQVQFRCMQLMRQELELPVIKIEYSGIAVSNKTYAFHADNAFPAKEEERNLGSPLDEKGKYQFNSVADDDWVAGNYPNRFYSTILFLNSDFEGGEEVFPQHDLEIIPRQGRLVVFPSSKDYVHGFRKCSRGARYTLSTWYNKVFTYYDQKANEKTKNMDTVGQVLLTVSEEKLLINV